MAPTQALHLPSVRSQTFAKRSPLPRKLWWPHVLKTTSSIHPSKLVSWGWYYSPRASPATAEHGEDEEEIGRTRCYLCQATKSDWVEGDEPSEGHSADCAWLVLLSIAKEWTSPLPRDEWAAAWGPDGLGWPRSERMVELRRKTFEHRWQPEQGVPSGREVADAGWYYAPGQTTDEEDRCACVYCGRSVSGWEKGDDAIALHFRKDGENCPFFVDTEPPAALQKDECATKTTKKAKGKSKSKASEAPSVAPVIVEEERPASPVAAAAAPAKGKRKTKRSQSTASEATASRRAPSPTPSATEEPVMTRATRSRANSVATESEPEIVQPTTKSARRASKKAAQKLAEEAVAVEAPAEPEIDNTIYEEPEEEEEPEAVVEPVAEQVVVEAVTVTTSAVAVESVSPEAEPTPVEPTPVAEETAVPKAKAPKAKSKSKKATGGKKTKTSVKPLEDSTVANTPDREVRPLKSQASKVKAATTGPSTPSIASPTSPLPSNPFSQTIMTEAEVRQCGTVGQYFEQLKVRALEKERAHSAELKKRFLEHATQVEKGLEALLKEARAREKRVPPV